MKKFLITIGIILFVGLIGFAVYVGIQGKQSTGEEGESFKFRDFLPFGAKEEVPPEENLEDLGPTLSGPTITGAIDGTGELSQVMKLTDYPTAGFSPVSRLQENLDEEGETVLALVEAVRAVSRISGNIEDIYPSTRERVFVSGRLIPKVHEALLGTKGSSVLYRMLGSDLETVQTFAGVLSVGASADTALEGIFLPEGITDVSVNNESGAIFYLSPFGVGASGSTTTASGDKRKQVIELPLAQWLSSWLSPDEILLVTKPSGFSLGYAYKFNLKTNVFSKLIGRVFGLTALPSPNGESLLIGEFKNNSMDLSLFDLSSSKIASLGIPRYTACSCISDAHEYFQTNGPPAIIALSFLAHPSLKSLAPYSTLSVSSPASITMASVGFSSSL